MILGSEWLMYLAAQRSRHCLPHEETVHHQSHRHQPSWHCAGGRPPGFELLHLLSSGWRAPPGAQGVEHRGSPGSPATACMCHEQLSVLSDAEGLLQQTLTGKGSPATVCMVVMSTYQCVLMQRNRCKKPWLAQRPLVQHKEGFSVIRCLHDFR